MENKNNAFVHDDWLEKERIRESKISVWDFDDKASFLKDEHSRDCDARRIRREHEIRHKAYTERTNVKPANINGKKANAGIFAVAFAIIYIIMMFVFIFS